MGKALQVPEEHALENNEQMAPTNYWSQGSGKVLQDAVVQIVFMAVNLLPKDTEVIDTACSILRSGFNEVKPGLFVFPPSITLNFVSSSSLDTARIEHVFDTAGAMLVKHFTDEEQEPQSIGLLVLNHAQRLVGVVNGNYPFTRPKLRLTWQARS